MQHAAINREYFFWLRKGLNLLGFVLKSDALFSDKDLV